MSFERVCFGFFWEEVFNLFCLVFWCSFTSLCSFVLYNEQLHEAKLISFRRDECKQADLSLVIVAVCCWCC